MKLPLKVLPFLFFSYLLIVIHTSAFRFITEKKFEHRNWFLYYPEEGNTRGAPTDLLRGVEFGIETKALLYKRMCAYAGLHAIVIKGFCKAKEYKPSEEFVDNRWRNAWNAVYVAGGWRLVQPNWAAMQVQTKVRRELAPGNQGFLT